MPVNPKKLIYRVVFLFLALAELGGRLAESETMNYVFKPTLLLWLLFYTWRMAEARDRYWHLILVGFVLSWLGDVFLMFSGTAMFMAGLGSFLLAHVCYIAAFARADTGVQGISYLLRRPVPAILIIVAGVGMYLYLIPYVGAWELRIAVTLYMLAIVSMALAAYNRYRPQLPGYNITFLGALLFMLSDSVLAANMFVEPVAQSGFIVMSTYIAAQWCIAEGTLLRKEG